MKILDIVKFNDHIGLVVDEIPALTYEKHGSFLIGSDDSGILFDCLHYERPIGEYKAFAGREFDLPMKDGSITHCWGQYWQDEGNNAAEILGISLAHITIQTLEKLKRCYVFSGVQACREAYYKAVADYLTKNPEYKIWGYHEYNSHITGRPILPNCRNEPSEEFQQKIREIFC